MARPAGSDSRISAPILPGSCRSEGFKREFMKRILSIVILGLVVAGAAVAARSDFPQPKALEPDVTFWKRIYSEVGTDGGLIHDDHDLGLVYEVVKFPSRYGADRYTETRKRYYQNILRTLAAGKRSGLSADEQRVLALFGSDATSARLRLASERIRFQLGQADKFRAGVIRSGAYKDHILEILRDMNLPLEIANLPHVESSFTPNIYSRVGAAGLWQFTSATGRRFMQVDAAQQLGTKDIARIVREYQSRTFGFASRNFYVEFLAANHVASNHEDYFGKLALDEPIEFETVALPYYARSRDLASALGVDPAILEKANPALRPGVWRNANFVPKGFKLRVPTAHLERPITESLAAIPASNRYASQSTTGTYTVRRGDTLSRIASRNGLTTQQLAALNGLRRTHSIRVGQRLKLPNRTTLAPMAPSDVMVAAAPPPPKPQPKAIPTPKATEAPAPEVAPEKPTVVAAVPPQRAPEREPVGAAHDEGGPTDEPTTATVTTSYTVRRGDSLTRIAKANGISVAELSAMNDLGRRTQIKAGQRLRIVKEAPVASRGPDREVQVAKNEPTSEKPRTPAAAPTKPSQAAAPTAAPKVASTAPPTPARAPSAPQPKPAPTVPAKTPPTPPTPSAGTAVADATNPDNDVADGWDAKEESAVDPSPGLLADPSDYTIAPDRTIVVQPNETLGHYAEWLGVRASRLRQLNGMRFGEPVVLHQKLRLDFTHVPAADFERIRTEYHRELQEAFFAEWEIEGTSIHKVGPGDSIWSLSTRRFAVPIWLLRQYNPDVDLDSLSAGTQITVPKLRQRSAESSARDVTGRSATAG
jgi:membrane-bound lytic murein transglycosylase D